jgi:hypothetical protein
MNRTAGARSGSQTVSLVYAVSFVVSRRLGNTEAFAYDRNFTGRGSSGPRRRDPHLRVPPRALPSGAPELIVGRSLAPYPYYCRDWMTDFTSV